MTSEHTEDNNPSIVQFLHPGREYEVTNGKSGHPINLPWVGGGCDNDCGGHSRRLVSHVGDYVDANGKVKTSQLVFWTEWEACTTAIETTAARNSRFSARWIHTVKTPLMEHPGTLNTDPCVFGSTFKYCCCQQSPSGTMQKLVPGSLVLFGSKMGDRFLLDTVFVVSGKGLPYNAGNEKQITALGASKEYRSLSLDRLKDGAFTFYRGATFDPTKPDHPFSFTPARHFDKNNPSCGERFKLDLAALNQLLPDSSRKFSPGLSQHFKAIDADAQTIFRVWQSVLQYVRAADFVPGIRFDWPQLKTPQHLNHLCSKESSIGSSGSGIQQTKG